MLLNSTPAIQAPRTVPLTSILARRKEIAAACSGYGGQQVARRSPIRLSHNKHFGLEAVKIKRAEKVLKAGSETEAIDRALGFVISEHERNRLAREANERFVKSGIAVKDVYGTLEP